MDRYDIYLPLLPSDCHQSHGDVYRVRSIDKHKRILFGSIYIGNIKSRLVRKEIIIQRVSSLDKINIHLCMI